MENDKIICFTSSPYEVPSLIPTLKSYLDYNYYVPNNKDGETYQTFKEIQGLYDNCALHSSILNTLIQEIYGTGLIAQTPQDEAVIKKYKLNKLFKKVIFDYVLYGGSYIEVIWNEAHTDILDIKYIPYSQIRLGNYNKEQNEEIMVFFHNIDWKSWKKKEITPLVRFNEDPKFDGHQVLPIFYNENKVYPVPYYYALFNDIYTMIDLSRFYRDLIANNFSPDTIITIPGNLEQEQLDQLRTIFDKTMKGPNGLKTILFNPQTVDAKPTIEKVNNQDDGQKYEAWNALFESKLLQGHGVTTPILFGIKEAGQLGGTEELKIGYNIYRVRKVIPMRNDILEALDEINNYLQYPLSQIVVEDLQILPVEEQTNTNESI